MAPFAVVDVDPAAPKRIQPNSLDFLVLFASRQKNNNKSLAVEKSTSGWAKHYYSNFVMLIKRIAPRVAAQRNIFTYHRKIQYLSTKAKRSFEKENSPPVLGGDAVKKRSLFYSWGGKPLDPFKTLIRAPIVCQT